MGYGPSPAPKRTLWDRLLPEYGTYMEFRKLKKAEAEKAKTKAKGGKRLMTVPKGEFEKFDEFEHLLESGAETARKQRKYLIGIPLIGMFMSGGTFGYAGYVVFSEGLKGVPAAEVVKDNGHIVQLAIVMLCFMMVCLCASISPTSIKQIYYTNIGLASYFLICGGVLCPVFMPQLLPDKTGTVYKLWMACGIIKCFGYIASLVYGLCTQPPRKCLRLMEWGLMVVIVGIGLFVAAANAFCMLDHGDELPFSWYRGYVYMSLTCIVVGYLAVTDMPRALGKAFLVFLHRIQSPGTSFDQQVLAATITIMVGADSGFREILSQALQALRGISLADVTWDEFKENTPNPKCYKKSRKVEFKAIDFFISHSWSDDPTAKWEAVQSLRKEFKKKHKREPIVWFDKYCIDQDAIDQSVRRLPIFVVASSKFYVLLGPSYATRCWCMLELFVFKACQRCGLFADSELVIAPLKSNDTDLHLRDLAEKFNIHDTKCYRDVDRQTIFGIVETAGDGHLGFTEAVRSLAKAAGEQSADEPEKKSPASRRPAVSPKASPKRGTSPKSIRKRAAPTPPASPPGEDEDEEEMLATVEEEVEEEEEEKVEVVVV